MSAEIAAIVDLAWEQTLGVAARPDADFFELGGHSLLAMQLIERLQERLGLRVPLRLIFEDPCLARFAERVSAFVEREHGALARERSDLEHTRIEREQADA